MGNASSQSETPTTTSQSQDGWKPIRLCGTLPAEVVPAERYVQQLWRALDMTHEKAQCGLKSDTPVGQGGTLDTKTYKIIGAVASKNVKTEPLSVQPGPSPGVPAPPPISQRWKMN